MAKAESHLWEFSFPGTMIRAVGSGLRIQISGKKHQPDKITRSVLANGDKKIECDFSESRISVTCLVEQKANMGRVSGVLRNLGSEPVRIEQVWLGESNIDLEGDSERYRIYYQSGSQWASGTCFFSDRKKVVGGGGALIDPDDPDTITITKKEGTDKSCIQKDHIYSHYLTAVYCKENKTAVCLGNASFERAETIFFVKPGSHASELLISPVILYNGLQIDPGKELVLEEIAFYYDKDPFVALERYVDDVAARKKIRLKAIEDIPPFWNVWYAYTEEENNSGADARATEYQKQYLTDYGLRSITLGVAHLDNAFFETRCKPSLGKTIAGALMDVKQKYPEFCANIGCFFGAASECSDFFAQHPEAILRDKNGDFCSRGPKGSGSWGRCRSPAYWIDFSHPKTLEFFREFLLSIKPADVKRFSLDFTGDHGQWKGSWEYVSENNNPFLNFVPHDAHVNRPFKTDRVVPALVRQILGDEVIIHSFTALMFRYLGLVDFVRIAPDSGRFEYGGELEPIRWELIRAILRNFAANYMFHGKWWWSDADACCIGTRVVPDRIEAVRIRTLLVFIVGGPFTMGDKAPQMAPEQFRCYTINIPATGHAAKPLDLFEKDIPEIYHLPRNRTGYGHDLLTLINLTNQDRDYKIQLSDLGIAGECLAFEFWTKNLMKVQNGVLQIALSPLTGRHFALHKALRVPQVVGTDFHLSMGGMELSSVKWDTKQRALKGVIKRPAREKGCIYILIPSGFKIGRITAQGGKVVSTHNNLLTLEIDALKTPATWSIALQ